MDDAPPATIGKYQLTEQLGQGSMGVVYKAFDPDVARHVAIKLMGRTLAGDKELRERFLQEAKAAGRLKHPNIVSVHDAGKADGHLYIVMEYVDGHDLSEIIERGDPLSLAEKLAIIVDVLHALEYAHHARVIHRDIKPANIRVTPEGRAKLMDFGIARLETSVLTRTGMLMGTPNYMAPELVNGQDVVPATDIFSLGAVAYEFLSGRQCFGGDKLMTILFEVVNKQPPPLTGVPRAVAAVIEKALAKDPSARYASAAEMANALL